ncbi:MAG: aldo/keto reductase [Polyangiaceae bacterium]
MTTHHDRPEGAEAEWFRSRWRDVIAPRPLVALGCMNFGKRTPEKDALRIVDRAFERGVTFFDTANAYVDGQSETILGKALKGRRDRAIVSSKVGMARVSGRPEGLSRRAIESAIDSSLARLGTDWLDVYYLHVPDHGTPVEESLDAMGRLVESGKVKRVGISNYATWETLEMIGRSATVGTPRPVIAQQLYNPILRELDVEWFSFARKYDVHTSVYNPLAGGLLARGPVDDLHVDVPKGSRFDGNVMYQKRYWSEPMMRLAGRLQAIAREASTSLVALSYGFVASTKGVDSILVGPGTVAHLDDALDALDKPLDATLRARVDAAYVEHVGTNTHYVR